MPESAGPQSIKAIKAKIAMAMMIQCEFFI
jgi:hypothetical protein